MLAEAAVLGVPVDRLLRTDDATERDLLRHAVAEASKVMDDLLSNLARKIVNEYASAKEKGARADKGKGG